ncbi:hypothetical protein GLYMA_02G210300v4 [Glycine max]|uniref:Uncharacterized protein n=1 Tax=Glycine max TaxID=3847 RepID=I1JGW3_SOYBN|nr:uncharacterized protein LOC100802714 [Glycine max]KAG5063945.1 hypothetical protein JHK85_005128 [Glycine max]KAG5080894.1 hypothetical protein JHK86_004959 [Glycine max]KAH1061400.1 hypothetical protein GYH30_004739 [Glycine max]KRH72409.1 hypothetical protein GLYMA_02G210300v4 [Glycine max]|eukprot:XP_003519183.1 uncharacterized protein LOC100802714 [Glycine max]
MMANTIFTQTITCLAVGKYPASNVDHPNIHPLRFNSKLKENNRFSVPEKNLALRFQNGSTRKMNMAVYASIIPGDPIDPSPGSPGSWKIWIIGTIFTILVSFTRGKWGPLLQLKEKVETTIDEAQRVVDIIEDVAEGVDKVAEEAVKHLPDGKFRDAVEFVEKVAEDIDKRAERAEDALEKVENMEKEFESFIESTTHHQENSVTTTAEAKEQK